MGKSLTFFFVLATLYLHFVRSCPGRRSISIYPVLPQTQILVKARVSITLKKHNKHHSYDWVKRAGNGGLMFRLAIVERLMPMDWNSRRHGESLARII